MASSTASRKPLGVRATPDQHRVLTEAAAKEHRSVSNFVLQAAMKAAEKHVPPPPKYTAEETLAGIREAQALFRQSDLYGRDLVAELIVERRAEATRE